MAAIASFVGWRPDIRGLAGRVDHQHRLTSRITELAMIPSFATCGAVECFTPWASSMTALATPRMELSFLSVGWTDEFPTILTSSLLRLGMFTPTTRSSCPRWASTSLTAYRTQSTSNCRDATSTNSLNRDGARPSRRSPSSSPGTRQKWPTTVCSPRCCSPTSWTRHAPLRRSATVTGMPCSMRTTRSSERNSLAFEAVR
jgi:hypothetical protein